MIKKALLEIMNMEAHLQCKVS